MDKQRLLAVLKEIVNKDDGSDAEGQHKDADRALLDYINDKEVTDAFDEIDKWYA